MTTTRFFLPRLPSGIAHRPTLVTLLAAALALGFGPATFAQEAEEEERSVRVMVLGDGQVEVLEDAENARVPGSQARRFGPGEGPGDGQGPTNTRP